MSIYAYIKSHIMLADNRWQRRSDVKQLGYTLTSPILRVDRCMVVPASWRLEESVGVDDACELAGDDEDGCNNVGFVQ